MQRAITMNEPASSQLRPMRRRWVTVAAWTLGAGALALSVLRVFSGEAYWLDLLANLGAQMLILFVLLLRLRVRLEEQRARVDSLYLSLD